VLFSSAAEQGLSINGPQARGDDRETNKSAFP
jgi:hypothetical protein